MPKLSTKLTDRLKGIRKYPVGISGEDIVKVPLTRDLIQDILRCLASDEAVDQQMALLFADVLVRPGNVGFDQQKELIGQLLRLCSEGSSQAQPSCYKLLYRFRTEISDYKSIMFAALKSVNPMVRKEAILAYSAYSTTNTISDLEHFEFDDYLAEVGMNGPLVYELRDLALETINKILSCHFERTRIRETLRTGQIAYWWDWSPYHAWKNKLRRSFLK